MVVSLKEGWRVKIEEKHIFPHIISVLTMFFILLLYIFKYMFNP